MKYWLVSCIAFVLFALVSCDDSGENAFFQDEDGGADSSASMEADAAPTSSPTRNVSGRETRYVWSNSGLVLRKSPGLDGERVGSVDFADKVYLGAPASEEISVGGTRGYWRPSVNQGDTVFLFDGFTLPLPPPGAAGVPTDAKAYADYISRQNMGGSYKQVQEADGNSGSQDIFDMYLPLRVSEGVLFARKLFKLSDKYVLPEPGKEVTVKEKPYDGKVTAQYSGEIPTKVEILRQTEGAAYNYTLTPEGEGLHIHAVITRD